MNSKDVNFKASEEKKSYGPSKTIKNVLNLLYLLLRGKNKRAEDYIEYLTPEGEEPLKVKTVKKYIDDIRRTENIKDPDGGYLFNIIYDRGKKCYKLVNAKDTVITFLPSEVEALYMAVNYLSPQEGTPLVFLKDLDKKLQKCYEKDVRIKLKKPVLLSGPKTESRLMDMLDEIDNAIVKEKKLLAFYTKTYDKKPEEKKIFPYCLMIYDYEWYLKGFCFKDKITKTFPVNQLEIIKTERLDGGEKREMPVNPDISVVHRWDWVKIGEEKEPVKVRIKFRNVMAERVRKKFKYRQEHPTQEVEEYEDSVIVSYRVRNPVNMEDWILGYGPMAEVMEPEFLRRKMIEILEEMLRVYNKK